MACARCYKRKSSNFSRHWERFEIVLVDGKFKISYIDWEMLYALWMTMVTDYLESEDA